MWEKIKNIFGKKQFFLLFRKNWLTRNVKISQTFYFAEIYLSKSKRFTIILFVVLFFQIIVPIRPCVIVSILWCVFSFIHKLHGSNKKCKIVENIFWIFIYHTGYSLFFNSNKWLLPPLVGCPCWIYYWKCVRSLHCK